MKKINFLLPALFFAFVIGFSSCSDDDDDINVVGMWNIDKKEVVVKVLGQTVETDTETNIGELTFEADGTGNIDLGYVVNFTWTLSGKTLEVDGGVEFGGDYTVKSYTSSKMVLEQTLAIPFAEEIITFTLSKL